jgi:hypothetical protein
LTASNFSAVTSRVLPIWLMMNSRRASLGLSPVIG